MPFVDGKYQPLSDSQIGSAPTATQQPGAVPDAPIYDTSTIGGDLQQQFNDEGNVQKLNPFRQFGNLYTTIVRHAFTPPSDTPKSFLEKSLEDVASLGAILPTIVSHPIKTAEQAPAGIVESVKNMFTPQYYKDHPVLGVVNAVTNITGVAGLIRAGVTKSVLISATDVAATEAVATVGLDSAKTAAITVTKQYLATSVKEAMKTGSFDIVKETLTNGFIDRGFTPIQAESIAGKVTESVQAGMTANAGKLGILSKVEHPVTTLKDTVTGTPVIDEAIKSDLMSKGVSEQIATDIATSKQGGLSPVTKSIFGEPAKTAVGQIYGTAEVAKNPSGFLDIENWAGQQAVEKGLKNTVANRVQIMNDWATAQGDWNLLSPEERIARHQNYIQATQLAQKVNALTGDLNVPTKFLPPSHVEAIIQSIKDAPKGETPIKIWDELKKDYGNDVALHEKTVQTILEAHPESRQGLIDAISSMGKRNTLSYHKLPEVNALIKQLEDQTGYRLIEAPQGKNISFAEGVKPSPELPLANVDVGATSFRGEPVTTISDTLPYYNTPRAKGFVNFMKDISTTYGVTVDGVKKSAGVWEGSIEPSFQAKITAPLDKVYQYAAALGRKGNQDAVILFKPGEGAGIKHIFENLPDPDGAIAKLQDAGISGGTIDGHSLIVYDLDGTLTDAVTKLSDDLGIKPTSTNGTVKLIERADYAKYSRGLGNYPDANLPGTVDSTVAENPALVSAKGRLQSMMERFGLSPNGDQSGSLEAAYADEFAQNANKVLGEKYGSTIKLGNKTLPIDKLYSWLDRHKNDIMQSGAGINQMHYSVSDLAVSNLTRLGIEQTIAKDIVTIARQSLSDIPVARTGLAEGLVNLMRAKSSVYNSFYKIKNYVHFNSPLAVGFAVRKQFKNSVLASMGVNKLQLDLGEVMNNSVRSTLQRIPFARSFVPYLDEVLTPQVNLNEVKLMADEVLYDINKNVIDYASNPELASIQKDFFGGNTIDKSTRFARSIQDRNAFSRLIGYNVQSHATAYAKGLASKYGMSLEDALGYQIKDGVKTYNNPEMANMIKDGSQAIFHYKPGILTSPLMRTLNTVWFPLRFEAKVAQQTAQWFSGLSPASRIVVADSMVHFVNYKNSPEGQKWLKEHKSKLEPVLDYLLPYAGMGHTVQSFGQGRVFDGNTGMIGGLPLGLFTNVLQDWGIVPEGERVNPVTGKKVTKQVPKKFLSEATAVSALEDLVTFILPSDPSYTLLGGTVSPFSQVVKERARGAAATITPGGTSKENLKKINKEFKTVPTDYSRFFGK
jgi:hypothetical protein